MKPERRNGDGKGALRWGILLTALGMALCVGLFPIGFWVNIGNRSFPFGPWLLPGLLPMFFGLGLVLIYVLTREPKPKDEVAAKEVKPPPDTATAKIELPPAQ